MTWPPDHPLESFEMIAKRVVPKGFGKSKTSAGSAPNVLLAR
jgi:hypothetical protein